MKINLKVAEAIGIILGDGHLHTRNNLITITGSLENLSYYQRRVSPLFQEVFGKNPTLRKRNDRNAYYLMLNSKEGFNLLINKIGMKRGSKKDASIPQCIFSSKNVAKAFLRGMFDTDGCIKFSKQSKNINYYPRIQIALKENQMAHQIGELLDMLGFKYGKWKEQRFSGIIFYQISGHKNTKKWFKEIKPQNQVHVTKFLFWLEFGYYIPKCSLEYRRNSLKPKPI